MSSEKYVPRWSPRTSATTYLCEYAAWCSRRAEGSRSERVFLDLLALDAPHSDPAWAALYDWTRLNVSVIQSRRDGQGRFGHGGESTKPRIDVDVDFTRPGNLSVRWRPTGVQESPWRVTGALDLTKHDGSPTDFVFFDGYQVPGYRPAHELLFVREAGLLYVQPEEIEARGDDSFGAELLLCAVRATLEELLFRLRDNFNVTLLNDVQLELVDGRAVGWRVP